MDKPESFEVLEYEHGNEFPDFAISAIQEIIDEQVSEHPNMGVIVKFEGENMKLSHCAYEMFLHQRIKEVEEQSKKILDETVKNLKKKFKEKTGKVLKVSEKKDDARVQIEKVSLNERYMYVSTRVYEIG